MNKRKASWYYRKLIAVAFALVACRTIYCLAHDLPVVVWIFAVFVAGYTALIGFAVYQQKKREKSSTSVLVKRAMKRWVYLVGAAAAVLYLIHEGYSIVISRQEEKITVTSTELDEMIAKDEQAFITENTTLSEGLKAVHYKNSTDTQRMKFLGMVVAAESKYLGIDPPALIAQTINTNSFGYYDVEMNKIVLNLDYLADEKQMIMAVLHEIYHVYEVACTKKISTSGDLLWQRQAKTWKEEFAEIKNDFRSNEGVVEFYTKSSEIEARKYVEERKEIYFKFM